jgi:hypothetical protein
VPETLGNLAQKYPTEAEKAIPKVLVNTKDKSTVVRWCAAFALTEIAKSNPAIRKEVGPKAMRGSVLDQRKTSWSYVMQRPVHLYHK